MTAADEMVKPEGRQYLIFEKTTAGQRQKIIDCLLEYQKYHKRAPRMEILMHVLWVDHVEALERSFTDCHVILMPTMRPQNAIIMRDV